MTQGEGGSKFLRCFSYSCTATNKHAMIGSICKLSSKSRRAARSFILFICPKTSLSRTFEDEDSFTIVTESFWEKNSNNEYRSRFDSIKLCMPMFVNHSASIVPSDVFLSNRLQTQYVVYLPFRVRSTLQFNSVPYLVLQYTFICIR